MNDIVAFLRARLDEDEAAAKKATGEHWEFDGATVIYGHALEQVVDYVYDDNQEHIARHDPARVLREIEAKRRIIADFEDESTPLGETRGLSGAIMHLTAVYDTHPDYQGKWRP
jgi:hypothetical protein